MSNETFTIDGRTYKITVYPAPRDGNRHPMVILLHGNFGLLAPYGDQIKSFAENLAGLGYVTAVPQYYDDDRAHPEDGSPDRHVATLSAAIGKIAGRPDADPDRLGLIGFSLGATVAMTYIPKNPPGEVKALADFFGFLTPTILANVGDFPPTIIFHNKNDQLVPVWNSQELDRLLPSTIAHELVPYDEEWGGINHAFQPGGLPTSTLRRKGRTGFSTTSRRTGRAGRSSFEAASGSRRPPRMPPQAVSGARSGQCAG